MTRMKTGVLIFALCFVCVAQQPMSVEKLLKFLRSEIQRKADPDKVIADYVRKIKLTERLDDRTIEQLQGEGLGPKTTEALRTLAATTGNLPISSPTHPAPKSRNGYCPKLPSTRRITPRVFLISFAGR
jgi:hypothetical protein